MNPFKVQISRSLPVSMLRNAKLLCLLLAAAPAWAQTSDNVLLDARRLIDAGEAQRAIALLEPEMAVYAGFAEFDLMLGQALYGSGQAGEALFAFERVLMLTPGNVEARLAIAKINFERGETKAAEEVLAPLAGQTLTAAQQRTLEQIRTVKPAPATATNQLAVRGYVRGSIGADSNVTSGPNSDTLIIPVFGPTPILLGAARQDADGVGAFDAGINLRQAIDDSTWLTLGGNFHQGYNRHRGDVEDSYVTLDMGVMVREGNEYFSATLLAQNYELAGLMYRKSVGARANWFHPVGESSRLTTYVQYMDYDLPVYVFDSTRRGVVGTSVESVFGNGAYNVQYGAYGGREKAKDSIKANVGFDVGGIHFGGSTRVGEDWIFAVGGAIERRRYLAADGLYPAITRNDTQYSIGVSADYRLTPAWHVIPQYTYLRNDSTIALYDYTRSTLTLQVRWDFNHEKN